jgi:hypothetical protein
VRDALREERDRWLERATLPRQYRQTAPCVRLRRLQLDHPLKERFGFGQAPGAMRLLRLLEEALDGGLRVGH